MGFFRQEYRSGLLLPSPFLFWAQENSWTFNTESNMKTKRKCLIYIFLSFCFDVDHFFLIFIEFVTILLLFYVMSSWPQGPWDLSSGTGDQTHYPLHWEAKSKSLNFQGSPKKTLLISSLLITSLSHRLHIRFLQSLACN